MCDINIPGLPTTLTSQIMPNMTNASIFCFRILHKAGCQVLFDDNKCQVIYNSNIILTGYKDPASNLWTFLIFPNESQITLDATH